jgi:hypothetical protein
MGKLTRTVFFFFAFLILPLSAEARVHISIDLSSQTMEVRSSGGESYNWPISSARSGYVTPRGVFSASSLQPMHYSKKYHNSPMPHSIFFHGGFAIHGTYEMRSLGRPASHGCVRISPAHAAILYAMVKAEGATITISGSPPPSRPFAGESRHRAHYAYAHHNWRSSAASSTRIHNRDEPQRVFGASIFNQD